MRNGRQRDAIAFCQESRGDDAHDQIFRRGRSGNPNAGLGIACDGPRRESPGGERVGILQRDLGLAGGVRDQIAEPEDCIREVLANLRLDLLVAFEVGERKWTPTSASQLQPFTARVAREIEVA